MIYSAGNFIECTVDTPYLQIGEHKYGKPILDRAVRYGIDIYDGLKIALLSMDSTLRSNLGVGMPIDVTVVRRDVCDAELVYRIEPGDALFPRPERALVGGAAGRAYCHSPPALRHAALILSAHLPSVNAVMGNAARPEQEFSQSTQIRELSA